MKPAVWARQLQVRPPEHLQLPDYGPRRAEHDPERHARQLPPRPCARELSLDEIEVVGDRGEVGAREVEELGNWFFVLQLATARACNRVLEALGSGR